MSRIGASPFFDCSKVCNFQKRKRGMNWREMSASLALRVSVGEIWLPLDNGIKMSDKFVDLIENSLPVLRRNGDLESMSLDGFSFENIKRGEYAFHVIGKLSPLEKGELLAAFRKVGSGAVAPVGGDGTESLERSCRGLAKALAADWLAAKEDVDDSTTARPLSIVAACAVVGISRAFDYDTDSVEEVRRSDRELMNWCVQYLRTHAGDVSSDVDHSFIEKFELRG